MDVSVAHAGDDGSVTASWLRCMSQLPNNSVAKHQYHANNSVDHANNPVAEHHDHANNSVAEHHDHANNSVAAHEDGEAGSRQREAEQEVVPSNTASMVEFRKVDTSQMVVPPNAMSATAAAAASIREQPVTASPRAVADQSESLGDQKMPMPAVQMHPAAQCADGHRVVHVVDDWTVYAMCRVCRQRVCVEPLQLAQRKCRHGRVVLCDHAEEAWQQCSVCQCVLRCWPKVLGDRPATEVMSI